MRQSRGTVCVRACVLICIDRATGKNCKHACVCAYMCVCVCACKSCVYTSMSVLRADVNEERLTDTSESRHRRISRATAASIYVYTMYSEACYMEN